MRYFALTGAAAAWLVGKASLLDALHRNLLQAETPVLCPDEELIEGPFHLALSSDSKVLGFWNSDYLNGTGDELWGFVRIEGPNSIGDYLHISREVLERCIYVISQRLQGLTIDGAFFPRAAPSGTHTCAAGRGQDARQVSIGYAEATMSRPGQLQLAVICVGPEQNWKILHKISADASGELPILVGTANQLIAPARKTKVSAGDKNEDLRTHFRPFSKVAPTSAFGDVEVETSQHEIDREARFNAVSLTYSDWVQADSPLTPVQRRILQSDAIDQHPIRIIGPGGSGKTLLMQLLAIRRMRQAEDRNEQLRILYVVHNGAMAQLVRQRFDVLRSDILLASDSETSLQVKTLSEVARELLELEDIYVIDTDAYESKLFQFDAVKNAVATILASGQAEIGSSRLLSAASSNPDVLGLLSVLIMNDISVAIKGQGLAKDRKRYVQSARSLSRFHGILNEVERDFVFRVFEHYHREVFESLEVLDSDDLAISLLGRIKTPIWELRRREQGYDYVFVDETQLFNENERRILPLLTNALRKHVPVVLALDEAQSLFGLSSAGFASLGIEGIANENLASIHRSTRAIVDLAFFVIQRSTDLFGADFPDFTRIADKIESNAHPLAEKPSLERMLNEKQELGKFVLKRVRELRRSNIRQICVIVHADSYWEGVVKELSVSDLPLHVMLKRGERIAPDQPIVVITRPSYVGGQEFDAVVVVGLEQGVTPPRVGDSEALSGAVEQQSLREIYLSLTRARYRVVIVLSHGSAPTNVIADAAKHGLLT